MATATGVVLSGPAAGSVNATSTMFTVSLVPTGGTSSGDTVTPASTLAGTFSPASVTLSTAQQSAVFEFTPTAEGTHSITITDSGSLTLTGTPLSYLAAPPPAAEQTLTANAVTPVRGATLSLVPGTWVPYLVTVRDCPAPITAASLIVKANTSSQVALLTKPGLVVDPGSTASDGSYTAIVLFNLMEADSVTALVAGTSYSFGIQVTTAPTHTVEVAEQCVLSAVSGGSTVG